MKIQKPTLGDKIVNFHSSLDIDQRILPDGIAVMNPFKESPYALQVSTAFYKKFYEDHKVRQMIVGINPGRHGAGVLGVPFTDTKRLQDPCGIAVEGISTHEPSSVFVYEMIEAYGGVTAFYNKFYINSISPLGFLKLKNGKETNFNYYDSKALQDAIQPYAVQWLKKQISFGLDTSVGYCLGAGKNFKFLSALNAEHHFFEKIIPLEHPRYIQQYKSKEKEAYITKYLESFSDPSLT